MTKMFGNLTDDGLKSQGDVIGGGLFDAGMHEGTVKLAYAGKSQNSDSQSITVVIDVNGKELRDTFWITKQTGENYYTDKQDPSIKRPLPGYTTADDLCLLTTGMPLSEQTVEDKVVKIYNYDEKKDVPTNVPVLTDVIGHKIIAGVIRQIVDKNQKDTSGKYVPTGETREENVIDKLFHAETHKTVTELREQMETAEFFDKWEAKNTGQVRNKAKGAQGKTGAPGRPAANGAPSANATAKPSLFAKT